MTFWYERLVKPFFFLQDPERAHERAVRLGQRLGEHRLARKLLAAIYAKRHPSLRRRVASLTFESPVGLAAGFDKECQLLNILPSLGFGFIEVGSITAKPYEGNPGPRLTRLPRDEGIIVYYGLKSSGARKLRRKLLGKRFPVPVGVSVAITNTRYATMREKLEDWALGVRLLKGCGDYLTINVSCPNIYEPLNWYEPANLQPLLARLDKELAGIKKPVLLKLPPDLPRRTADEIIRVTKRHSYVKGFILTNLVKDRSRLQLRSPRKLYEDRPGGISGRVVFPKALSLVKHFRQRCPGMVIIGCGGVFSPVEAAAYLEAGADLVQLVTGLIYKGPGLVKELNEGLARRHAGKE